MKKSIFIIVIVLLASCLGNRSRIKIGAEVSDTEIECNDSIKMLNLIKSSLAIDKSVYYYPIIEDYMNDTLIINNSNLPYDYPDLAADSLMSELKFMSEEELQKQSIYDYVVFEWFDFKADSVTVRYYFSPHLTEVIITKFHVNDCDITLVDSGLAFVNRLKFRPPNGAL